MDPQIPSLEHLSSTTSTQGGELLPMVLERTFAALLLSGDSSVLPRSGLFDWGKFSEQPVTSVADTISGAISQGMIHSAVLVGISGGSDSTALLMLAAIASRFVRMSVFACHVNYRLRGQESDLDEELCIRLCRAWGIPLHVHRCEPGMGGHTTSEESLRQLRYEVFINCAGYSKSGALLLGHTLDDQCETVLFRALRGSAPGGLRGIPAVRPLGAQLVVARPLLTVERGRLRELLKASSVPWRDDATNEEENYTRNFIRNQIAPKLSARFPDFQKRLERTRMIVVDEEALLDELASNLEETLVAVDDESWILSALDDAPPPLIRRVIARGLRERNIEVSFERVESIYKMLRPQPENPERNPSTLSKNVPDVMELVLGDITEVQPVAPPVLSPGGLPPGPEAQGKRQKAAAKTPPGRISLSGLWDVSTDGEKLYWLEKPEAAQAGQIHFEFFLKVPGLTVLPQIGFAVRIEEWKAEEEAAKLSFPPQDSDEALVDLTSTSPPMVLRTRRPADEIRPFGMAGSVRLKKYLHSRKKRPAYGFLMADKNQVLWVPGVGISEGLRVKSRPTHRISLIRIAGDDVALA